MNKYGEPWQTADGHNGDMLALSDDGTVERARCGGVRYYTDPAATANRIAACVNACAGLTDEQLAGGVVTVESVKRMVVGMTPSEAVGNDEWMRGYITALRHVRESLAEVVKKEG